MMSEKSNPGGTAEYCDTHDISADMEAGEWSRHEGSRPETTDAVPVPDGTGLTEQRAEELIAEIRASRDAR
jgi:hypothetical protein